MPTTKNIVIDQGSTFDLDVLIVDANRNPVNLTGYSFRASMRKTYFSSTATNFTITPAEDLTTGLFNLALTAEQTSAIKAGRYVYDIEIEDADGVVTRVFDGIATVTPEVTR